MGGKQHNIRVSPLSGRSTLNHYNNEDSRSKGRWNIITRNA